MTVIYAAIAERFDVESSSNSSNSSSRSGGGGGGASGGSIQDDCDGAVLTPLLALDTSTNNGGRGGSTCQPFDSSDGFSALFFLQSVAVGMLFFLMPLFASSETGVSSPHQFLAEEVGAFGFLVLGAAGFIADNLRRKAAARVRQDASGR